MSNTIGIRVSGLGRIAALWPYALVEVAVIGLASKVYRGTF